MKPSATPTETCGGALRYSISAVLIVLLLGLLPAACGHPEEQQTENQRPPDA